MYLFLYFKFTSIKSSKAGLPVVPVSFLFLKFVSIISTVQSRTCLPMPSHHKCIRSGGSMPYHCCGSSPIGIFTPLQHKSTSLSPWSTAAALAGPTSPFVPRFTVAMYSARFRSTKDGMLFSAYAGSILIVHFNNIGFCAYAGSILIVHFNNI